MEIFLTGEIEYKMYCDQQMQNEAIWPANLFSNLKYLCVWAPLDNFKNLDKNLNEMWEIISETLLICMP